MKKFYNKLFIILFIAFRLTVNGQNSPIWIQNLNTSPDSALLFPIKTQVDLNNNVFVLSNYTKYDTTGTQTNKIVLNKFDTNGNLLWNFDFDNNGYGEPNGFQMEIDDSGNCYVAGGLMGLVNNKPILIKVNPSGGVEWLRDSTTSFNDSYYSQLILKNDLLHVASNSGIGVFDLNGIEQWSNNIYSKRMAVDNLGRTIVSTFGNPSHTLFRYNVNGTLDFSDSTIVADRVAVDSDNNIYLLAQWAKYNLAKHDSSGVFLWWTDSFPENLSFVDAGFDLLVDYNNDVLLVGLNDTMFKHRPDGSRIWMRAMDGLDNYTIDAKITYSNFLIVSGSSSGTIPVGVKVSMFDLNGNSVWSGTHQSNIQQEFAISTAVSSDGIYLLEDSISSSSLLKFESPFNSTFIDYNLICVDSVWYDPINPVFINIRLFNGNIGHLNYPSIQMISPGGDTISNRYNLINFFAHLGNRFLIYTDTITVAGITDFSDYSFLVSEGFGDTTVNISWCATVGLEYINLNSAIVYPNPADNSINIVFESECRGCEFEIISIEGKKHIQNELKNGTSMNLDLQTIPAGLYFLRIHNIEGTRILRFIKR